MTLSWLWFTVQEANHYQDNVSAMKVEKNVKTSLGKNSRHVSIRYFFVKDRLESKKIEILHCPTDEMIADLFTKTITRKKFQAFQSDYNGTRAH